MQWVFSTCVHRQNSGNGLEIQHSAGVVEAGCKEAAEILALRSALKLYPQSSGWKAHSAVVSDLKFCMAYRVTDASKVRLSDE